MTTFANALAAFRMRHPVDVQAEADARVARVLGPLEELARDFDATLGRLCADGHLPDRRQHRRPLTRKETSQ